MREHPKQRVVPLAPLGQWHRERLPDGRRNAGQLLEEAHRIERSFRFRNFRASAASYGVGLDNSPIAKSAELTGVGVGLTGADSSRVRGPRRPGDVGQQSDLRSGRPARAGWAAVGRR